MSNVVKWEKEDNWVEIDTDLCSAAEACVDAWPIANDRQEERLRSLLRRVRFDCRGTPFTCPVSYHMDACSAVAYNADC